MKCGAADGITNRKYNKKYYQGHREQILKRRRERYAQNRDVEKQKALNRYYAKKGRIMTKLERIKALMGNLKNWSWDVTPQFRIEKEDAEVLQDVDTLKEYMAEREKYESIHNTQESEG